MPDPRVSRMTERQLDAQIEKIVADLGLLSYHSWTSVHSPSGWPDRVYARRHVKGHPGGAVLFAELKTEHGKVTPAQEAWLEALTFAGLQTAVWRPADLTSGRIARELAVLAGLPVAKEIA